MRWLINKFLRWAAGYTFISRFMNRNNRYNAVVSSDNLLLHIKSIMRNVEYRGDGFLIHWVQTPGYTLYLGKGDCEDMAIAWKYLIQRHLAKKVHIVLLYKHFLGIRIPLHFISVCPELEMCTSNTKSIHMFLDYNMFGTHNAAIEAMVKIYLNTHDKYDSYEVFDKQLEEAFKDVEWEVL